MSQLSFRVADALAAFTVPDPALADAVEDAMRRFGLRAATAEEDADLRFSVTAGAPPSREGYDKVVTFDTGVVLWRGGALRHIVYGASGLVLDPAAGTGDAFLDPALLTQPEALGSSLRGLLVSALVFCLQERQWFSLHAAALDHDGDGVLLAAPSGSGKSTLAYSLVASGWRYLSDDVVLLRDGAPVEVRPLRGVFTVTRQTRDAFPELARGAWECAVGNARKASVPMHALYPDAAAARTVPRLIVFPEIGADGDTFFEPLDLRSTFVRLLKESVHTTLDEEATRHYVPLLQRLVHQAPAFRLVAGRDLLGRPDRVRARFEALLADA